MNEEEIAQQKADKAAIAAATARVAELEGEVEKSTKSYVALQRTLSNTSDGAKAKEATISTLNERIAELEQISKKAADELVAFGEIGKKNADLEAELGASKKRLGIIDLAAKEYPDVSPFMDMVSPGDDEAANRLILESLRTRIGTVVSGQVASQMQGVVPGAFMSRQQGAALTVEAMYDRMVGAVGTKDYGKFSDEYFAKVAATEK